MCLQKLVISVSVWVALHHLLQERDHESCAHVRSKGEVSYQARQLRNGKTLLEREGYSGVEGLS